MKPVADVAYYPLERLAEATGKPVQESILGICLISNFFLSLLMSHIHSPIQRKIYSITLGMFMSVYTYGGSVILLIPYNMIAFISMWIFPRAY